MYKGWDRDPNSEGTKIINSTGPKSNEIDISNSPNPKEKSSMLQSKKKTGNIIVKLNVVVIGPSTVLKRIFENSKWIPPPDQVTHTHTSFKVWLIIFYVWPSCVITIWVVSLKSFYPNCLELK